MILKLFAYIFICIIIRPYNLPF